jgi:hypothetical protein
MRIEFRKVLVPKDVVLSEGNNRWFILSDLHVDTQMRFLSFTVLLQCVQPT